MCCPFPNDSKYNLGHIVQGQVVHGTYRIRDEDSQKKNYGEGQRGCLVMASKKG